MTLFHRAGGVLLFVMMLYLGITGTFIHMLDLRAFLAHAPARDLTMQSIRAGMYGEENFYQVMVVGDFDSAPLPASLDYTRALATVLAAVHRQAPGVPPRFVELRVANGATIGQARVGDRVLAFDAASGAPVPPVDVSTGKAPPSLRLTVKKYHRFWISRESPGVWFELLGGLALCALIVGGLLLALRRSARRREGEGRWRAWHRRVSVASALFLLPIAFSGAWIGFDSVVHMIRKVKEAGDISAPLADGAVQRMVAETLATLRRHEPGTSVRVLRVRMFGAMPQGVVISGDAEARQLVFDLDSGRPVTLTEPGYPENGFPFGLQMHEYVKYFHSFYMFGRWAQWFGLLAGLALIFLSVSGIVVEIQAWRAGGRGTTG